MYLHQVTHMPLSQHLPSPLLSNHQLLTGSSPLPWPLPISPTLTPRDSPPDTDSLPAAQPLFNTEPNPDKPAKPEAQVVLLMDSTGKYLDTKRLFPGLNTTATGHAMEDTLGSPQYIVVHTGTNELHTLHRGTAEAINKVAERASREFPDSRVIISPQDRHPSTCGCTLCSPPIHPPSPPHQHRNMGSL